MEEKKRLFWSSIGAKIAMQELPDEVLKYASQFTIEARRKDGKWFFRWKFKEEDNRFWREGFIKDLEKGLLEAEGDFD